MHEEVRSLSCGRSEALRFYTCGITYPDPSYFIRRPHSGVSVIEYVRSGAGYIETESGIIRVEAGDSYFLPEKFAQHYYADKHDPWEKIWLNFSGSLSVAMTESYQLTRLHYPKLYTEDCLLRILDYARHPREDMESTLSLALHEIFCRMASPRPQEERKDTRAIAMRRYLDQHLHDSLTIASLAEAVALSESSANRIFREAYHITPYAYLLRRRIELARDLLLSTTLSIKQIALSLAFADEFYFSGVFKREVGISPSRFRTESGRKCTN